MANNKKKNKKGKIIDDTPIIPRLAKKAAKKPTTSTSIVGAVGKTVTGAAKNGAKKVGNTAQTTYKKHRKAVLLSGAVILGLTTGFGGIAIGALVIGGFVLTGKISGFIKKVLQNYKKDQFDGRRFAGGKFYDFDNAPLTPELQKMYPNGIASQQLFDPLSNSQYIGTQVYDKDGNTVGLDGFVGHDLDKALITNQPITREMVANENSRLEHIKSNPELSGNLNKLDKQVLAYSQKQYSKLEKNFDKLDQGKDGMLTHEERRAIYNPLAEEFGSSEVSKSDIRSFINLQQQTNNDSASIETNLASELFNDSESNQGMRN